VTGPRAAAPLRLRRGRAGDAPAVAAVMRAAIRGLARGAGTKRQLAAWSSLPALYHAWAMSAGGESYVVATRGGAVAGYAALRGGEVTAVFVRPGEARRGVGAALLARLEREAARAGRRTLRVVAARSAVPFYAAMGFRGGRAVAVPLPGARLPARLLSKRLGAARGGRRGA
jgi:GNAT superfamily N-acetyltransferase